MSPDPVCTSRSTAPVTVRVRSKCPWLSSANVGDAARLAAKATKIINPGNARKRTLIFILPMRSNPIQVRGTQDVAEKFRRNVAFQVSITDSRVLGACAVALLVFLSRAAGAGIVAPDFCAGADRFGGCFRLRGSSLELQITLLALLALFDFLCFVLRPGRLH